MAFFRRAIFLLISFLLGVGVGLGLLYLLSNLPLPREHAAFRIFGIVKPRIVGFSPYWLFDKASGIYADQLTTFTYFGLILERDGTVKKLVNTQEEEPGWTNIRGERLSVRLEEAKKKNINTSLLVQSADDAVIAELLKDPEANGKRLVDDIAPVMKEKGFSDLNLDIESFKEATASPRGQFTAFVQAVKDELVQQKLGTLTVELTPITLVKTHLADAAAIGGIADTVVLMAYDYHYAGSFTAGPVAPIGGAGEVWEYDVETAIQEALHVIPKEKILLGIPLYGYEWETLQEAPGAATIPGGASTASHRRIAEALASCKECTKGVDPVSGQPYLIWKDGEYHHQIFYEDKESLQKKLDLAKKHELAGIALWALGYEGEGLLTPVAAYKKSFRFIPTVLPAGSWLRL